MLPLRSFFFLTKRLLFFSLFLFFVFLESFGNPKIFFDNAIENERQLIPMRLSLIVVYTTCEGGRGTRAGAGGSWQESIAPADNQTRRRSKLWHVCAV